MAEVDHVLLQHGEATLADEQCGTSDTDLLFDNLVWEYYGDKCARAVQQKTIPANHYPFNRSDLSYTDTTT